MEKLKKSSFIMCMVMKSVKNSLAIANANFTGSLKKLTSFYLIFNAIVVKA